MSEENRTAPEIVHGSARDDGAAREHTTKPCSKRLQGQHGIFWCTRPEGHPDECTGHALEEPLGTKWMIVRIDHRYGR